MLGADDSSQEAYLDLDTCLVRLTRQGAEISEEMRLKLIQEIERFRGMLAQKGLKSLSRLIANSVHQLLEADREYDPGISGLEKDQASLVAAIKKELRARHIVGKAQVATKVRRRAKVAVKTPAYRPQHDGQITELIETPGQTKEDPNADVPFDEGKPKPEDETRRQDRDDDEDYEGQQMEAESASEFNLPT